MQVTHWGVWGMYDVVSVGMERERERERRRNEVKRRIR